MSEVASAVSDIVVWRPSKLVEPPLLVPTSCAEFQDALPAHHGEKAGSVEVLRLNAGISMTWNAQLTDGRPSSSCVPIAQVTTETFEPVILVQRVLAGSVTIKNHINDTRHHVTPGLASFEHTSGVNFSLNAEANSVSEVITYIIGESSFEKIIGSEALGTLVNAAAFGESPAQTLCVPQNPSSAFRSRMATGIPSDMRRLLGQLQMIEHLCLLAAHLAGSLQKGPVGPKAKQMQDLHDELLSIDGKLPPLEELSKRYGMSVKTLNDRFKDMFGQTIGAYVANHRLNEARFALMDTDVPIKVLAAQLGYSHVNNFNNAFRHKFGYPPGSLRKQKA